MSFFYQTINDLYQPLLIFGILLALLQFSFSQINNHRQGKLRRIISITSESSQPVLFGLVIALGGYILVKLAATVIGWVLRNDITSNIVSNIISYNITEIREQIPNIDWQVAVGAFILLLASLIILIRAIRKFIKHKRSKTINWL